MTREIFYHVCSLLYLSEVGGEKVKEVDLLSCSPVNLGGKKRKERVWKSGSCYSFSGRKESGWQWFLVSLISIKIFWGKRSIIFVSLIETHYWQPRPSPPLRNDLIVSSSLSLYYRVRRCHPAMYIVTVTLFSLAFNIPKFAEFTVSYIFRKKMLLMCYVHIWGNCCSNLVPMGEERGVEMCHCSLVVLGAPSNADVIWRNELFSEDEQRN